MTDIDGRFKYSNIIRLQQNDPAQNRIVLMSPNPFVSMLTIQYESMINEKIVCTILNTKGQLVKQQSFNVREGNNQFYISGEHLSSGIYLLRLNTNSQIITENIIKQ